MNGYPEIGEKVRIDNKNVGIITDVYRPNEYHSGRFRVDIHRKPNFIDNVEFWFGDYGTFVIPMKK